MKRTFLFIFLLTWSYANVEAIACSTAVMFIVTETGTGEQLDEIVSLAEDNYNFEIEKVHPYRHIAWHNDKHCDFGIAISLRVNENGDFIKITVPVSQGLAWDVKDCVPVIKQIMSTFQKNNNLPIKTETIDGCEQSWYQ